MRRTQPRRRRILERPDGDIEMGSLEVNQDEEFVADEWVFDELSGQWLDAEKVTEGRREDIEYMEGELDMFIPATWEECMRRRAGRLSRRSGSTSTRAPRSAR